MYNKLELILGETDLRLENVRTVWMEDIVKYLIENRNRFKGDRIKIKSIPKFGNSLIFDLCEDFIVVFKIVQNKLVPLYKFYLDGIKIDLWDIYTFNKDNWDVILNLNITKKEVEDIVGEEIKDIDFWFKFREEASNLKSLKDLFSLYHALKIVYNI